MKQNVTIDKLNGHDTEGKIGKVNFKSGDTVATGDVLFTIESGKGSMKFKSEYTGQVLELDIKTGQVVKKGEVVGVIEGEKEAPVKKSGYSFGIAKVQKIEKHADVLVIGGGPGGYVAAIRSTQLGKQVVLIEEDQMGGTCLNYGCIPTKALAHSTKVLNYIKHSDEYGFDISSFSIDMPKVISRKQGVVESLVAGVEHLMESNDIEVIRGTATVADDKTIKVSNKKIDANITFDKLIIATGSSPYYLPIEGHDFDNVLSSKEVLELDEVPKSITIIGGGVIGMEFAFIFKALGSEVHVIEYLPEILCLLDQDVVDVIKNSAEEMGIKITSGACASRILKTENNQLVTGYQIDDKEYYVASDKVLMAVGRKPRLDSLDLEKLRVSLNEKGNGIAVSETMQTSNPDIYAIGDVTNIIQLAHVASHQGMVAAENIAGMTNKMHYDTVPSAIFTNPEVGHVGLTERAAIEKGLNITIGRFPFQANGKAIAMNETEGFVKVISDADNHLILGATIVGAHGTDMIAGLTHMIDSKLLVEEVINTIYAHPTGSEAIHEALLGIEGRGLHCG